MKENLKNLDLPETACFDGTIEVVNSQLGFKNGINGDIESAVVKIYLNTEICIGGIQISFRSEISHKLSDVELQAAIERYRIK